MKVKVIDIETPRSDGVPGGAQNITLGKVYRVAEIEFEKYSIINDQGKLARYNKYRFEVVDSKPPLSLRFAYNQLTAPLREEIRRLKRKLEEAGIDDQ